MTTETMRKVRKNELVKYGIIPRRVAVMDKIVKLGGKAKPADISRFLLREKHSMHEIIRRMEKDGLLKKIDDPNRKNGVLVSLTDKGLKIYRLSIKRETFKKIFSTLSKTKVEQLKSHLMLLLETTKKEIE